MSRAMVFLPADDRGMVATYMESAGADVEIVPAGLFCSGSRAAIDRILCLYTAATGTFSRAIW